MTNEMIHWNFLPTISFSPKRGVITPHEYLVECYQMTIPNDINDINICNFSHIWQYYSYFYCRGPESGKALVDLMEDEGKDDGDFPCRIAAQLVSNYRVRLDHCSA